ncbi:MAG: ligase-associated DNA damage response endonuclease PdeM [Polaromonas sp.]|nr:ligase-associated DNA damage response endonuclease PdeM [Polaromonas sp.]
MPGDSEAVDASDVEPAHAPPAPPAPGVARAASAATPGHATVSRSGFELLLDASGAVYLPLIQAWLVADAHFGKAVSFRRLGVPVPRGTTTATLARLSTLLERQPCRHIIFLGDFLHSQRSHAPATQAALAAWRAAHPDLALTLIRGNHDDRAGDPPAALGIQVVDEPFLVDSGTGRLALCHHPQHIAGAYVLAGHWHPCITVIGRAHDRLRLPCFWFGPEQAGRADDRGPDASPATGILPAFGAFTGMHPIERRPGDQVFAIAGDQVREVPARPPAC